MSNHINIKIKASAKRHLLRSLIKHEDRSVTILLINNLEACRIGERSLDASEGVQDFRHTTSDRLVERVLLVDALPRQAVLHMLRREEGVQRIDRILRRVIRKNKLLIRKDSPKGSGGASDEVKVSALYKMSEITHI